MKQFDDQEDVLTVWVNDTAHPAKFRLMLDKKGKAPHSAAFKFVTVPVGGKITLPKDFDDAIRTENEFGVVVGGLCPWLKKEGEVEVQLEPCLDFETVIEETKASKLADKLQKQKALEEARKLMAEEKVRSESEPAKRGRKPSNV